MNLLLLSVFLTALFILAAAQQGNVEDEPHARFRRHSNHGGSDNSNNNNKKKPKKDDKYYIDQIVTNLTSIREIIQPMGGVSGVLGALRSYQARAREAQKNGESDAYLTPVLQTLRKKSSSIEYLKHMNEALSSLNSLLLQLRSLGGLVNLLGMFTTAGAGAGGNTAPGGGSVVAEPVSSEAIP